MHFVRQIAAVTINFYKHSCPGFEPGHSPQISEIGVSVGVGADAFKEQPKGA